MHCTKLVSTNQNAQNGVDQRYVTSHCRGLYFKLPGFTRCCRTRAIDNTSDCALSATNPWGKTSLLYQPGGKRNSVIEYLNQSNHCSLFVIWTQNNCRNYSVRTFVEGIWVKFHEQIYGAPYISTVLPKVYPRKICTTTVDGFRRPSNNDVEPQSSFTVLLVGLSEGADYGIYRWYSQKLSKLKSTSTIPYYFREDLSWKF